MKSGLVAAAAVAALALSGASYGARLRERADERALVVVEAGEDAERKSQCVDCEARATPQQHAVPEFVATREWQDILPNQALPPVRCKRKM